MDPIIAVVAAVAALGIGVFLGKLVFAKNTQKQVEDAETLAKKIVEDAKILAETLKENKLLEAKEQAAQLKSGIEKEKAAYEKEVVQRNQKLAESENKFKQQQQGLNDKTSALQRQIQENEHLKETLQKQTEVVNIKRAELEKHQEEHIKRLEKVANLTAEEAKTEIIELVKEEAKTRAMAHVKDIMEDAKLNATKEAKKIIIQSIQRTAAEQTIENAITVFNLESDEIISRSD
jgi:ribonuclease Y